MRPVLGAMWMMLGVADLDLSDDGINILQRDTIRLLNNNFQWVADKLR